MVANMEDPWIYPVVRQRGWQKLGACHGQDPNVYVPEKKDSRDTIHYDKSFCQGCVVKEQCLDFALANRAKKGLWGGTTPKQRERMYSLYKGVREYELDMDTLVGVRKPDNDGLVATDCPAEEPSNIIRFPLAPNSPIHFSWVQEIYVQGTLFDATSYSAS